MKPKTTRTASQLSGPFFAPRPAGEVVNKLDGPMVYKKSHTYAKHEMAAMLSASNFEDKLVGQTFLAAGLRKQELSHLGWGDVLFECGLLHLHAKPDLNFSLKDAEERQIPLPTELLERLRERRTLRSCASHTEW